MHPRDLGKHQEQNNKKKEITVKSYLFHSIFTSQSQVTFSRDLVNNIWFETKKGRWLLTLRGPGVVLPEGLVFGDVWVEEAEWVLWDVLSCHHLVGADDVRQRDGRQFLLGVGLHCMEYRLICKTHTSRYINLLIVIGYRAAVCGVCFHRLTVLVVFHPSECDGSVSATLTEAQKERAWTLPSQHGLCPPLTHKAQDATVVGENKQHFFITYITVFVLVGRDNAHCSSWLSMCQM